MSYLNHSKINLLISAGTAVMFLGQAIPAAAQSFVVDVPDGLEDGDKFRFGFVVTEEFFTDALSSDIDFYNEIARRQAAEIDFVDEFFGVEGKGIKETMAEIEWNAIVSTATDNARDNTGTADLTTEDPDFQGMYLMNGDLFAEDNAQLWSGKLERPINLFPSEGGELNGRSVWTGTQSNGTASNCALGSGACGGVSTRGNSFFSGRIDGTEGFWTDDTLNVQSKEQAIYVLSSVMTVDKDMPEPGMVISLVTLGGIFLGTSRRKKSTKK